VKRPNPVSECALVLAPNGRDSQIAVSILKDAGLAAEATLSLPALVEALETGAGLAVITDEAVQTADLRSLVEWLHRQPPWSDLPIVLLTHRGGGPERNPAAARLAEALGNVTFVERPFHPTTLVSVAKTAIRGRRRQYEARGQLVALADRESRLTTALTAGRLGSWTLNMEPLRLSTSQTCRRHFGRPDNLGYQELIAAIHPDDRERVEAALARTRDTGEDFAVDYRNIWPDGSIHWAEVRASTVSDENGKILQLVGVSSDITDRKQAELELSQLAQTLEARVEARTGELLRATEAREQAQEQLRQAQKMESLGKLTGGVAHDFNNLLMAVMGNLELLAKRLPNDPRMHRLLDGAMQGTARGASLTQRLLAFARQQDLQAEPVDLAGLVRGMRDLLDQSLETRIALSVELSPGLPAADVDANQVELAVLNLVINARDAMPEGGSIAIRLDDGKSPPKALKPGRYLKLSVVDDGSGMDAATLKRAVEPFFSTKPLGKGTGLGLSMVHGLAVQLGGQLELTSAPGQGTTATLWLPASTGAPERREAEASPAGTTRGVTILLVDDDPLVAASTSSMLEDLGHTVIEAASGAEAIEALSNGRRIDLLMTDYAMPGMTGMELTRQARALRPDLPILMATGYADLPEGESLDLPRLAKPYQQAQLRAEIDRLLQPA
jgi:PAS domain S-box-containing protein